MYILNFKHLSLSIDPVHCKQKNITVEKKKKKKQVNIKNVTISN